MSEMAILSDCNSPILQLRLDNIYVCVCKSETVISDFFFTSFDK